MAVKERDGKDRRCSLQRVEGNEQGRKVVGQVDTGIRCEVAMCDFVARLKPDAGGPIAMEHFQKEDLETHRLTVHADEPIRCEVAGCK